MQFSGEQLLLMPCVFHLNAISDHLHAISARVHAMPVIYICVR